MIRLGIALCLALLADVGESAQLRAAAFLPVRGADGSAGQPAQQVRLATPPGSGSRLSAPLHTRGSFSSNASSNAPSLGGDIVVEARVPVNSTGAYASVGHFSSNAETSNFLGRLSRECSCHFQDLCNCDEAMAFMNCVSEACASGRCDCGNHEFLNACDRIGGFCHSLDISCSSGRAVCMYEDEASARSDEAKQVEVRSGYMRDEPIPDPVDGPMVGGSEQTPLESRRSVSDIYDELKALKEKKCALDLASDEGWYDTSSELPKIKERIRECMQELAAKQAPIPEMHCEKHFEEWDSPPRPAGRQSQGPAKGEAPRPATSWGTGFALAVLFVASSSSSSLALLGADGSLS